MIPALSTSLPSLRALCLLSILLLSGPAPARPLDPAIAQVLAERGEVRVLVMLAPAPTGPLAAGDPVARVEALLEQLPVDDTRVERRFQTIPAVALTVGPAGLAALRASDRVAHVDLDAGGSGDLLESLPLAEVAPVRALGYAGTGTKVAIIDSGLRLDHQSFAGRVVGEACFCTTCCPNGQATQVGPGSGANSHPHGTNVAGIAVGAAGVPGVPAGAAGAAGIVSIRVLDASNSFCCASDVIAGMDWLRVNHPDTAVVNLSLGTSARFPGHCDNATAFTQAFSAVVNGLIGQGTSVTVSSGNNGSSMDMQTPACIQNATSVAAVWDADVGTPTILGCTETATAADQVTCFSNLSPTTDLLAPGAWITAAGTGSPTGTSTFAGTSMAAPLAAGCIALLREAFAGRSPAQIEAALLASPTRLTRPPLVPTWPRLNCLDAFARLDQLFFNGFQ